MEKTPRRYQMFISSTYKDLIKERDAVIMAILKNYHFPIGMEMFHADDQEQWVQIANTIDMSDFYILIMGNCCGTLIENDEISYTEKEYNYARSKGIPVLAFIIDPHAPTIHFEENAKQRKAYKKFRSKVEKLPRTLWKNKDDLALSVITTLHAKIKENKRNGWIPYNPSSLPMVGSVPSELVGTYETVYFSALSNKEERYIRSELTIDSFGNATYCNNIESKGTSSYEFIYHGVCEDAGSLIYIHLKNDHSGERAMMELIRPVGDLERYFGLFTACSVNNVPVCVKIACIKQNLMPKVSREQLTSILLQKNEQYKDHALIIEENAKTQFFSDFLFENYSVEHSEIDIDYYVEESKITYIKTCKVRILIGGKNRIHNRITWFANEDVELTSLNDGVEIEHLDLRDTNRNFNVVFDRILERGDEVEYRIKAVLSNKHKQFKNFFSTEVITPIGGLNVHLNLADTSVKKVFTQKLASSPMNRRTEPPKEHAFHSPHHWRVPNPELNFEYKIYW